MTTELFLSILAGCTVIVGLLFLSMIHLFMIPKDVRQRDTDMGTQGDDTMPGFTEKPEMGGDIDREPKPEIEREPADPDLEPQPEPEIIREPAIREEPAPELDPEKERRS